MVRLTDHFRLFVPSGRAVSPITSTNWEGVGVQPDIRVGASKAFLTAYLDVLKSLESRASSEERKRYLRSAMERASLEVR
jgi:hypothetical protein